MAGEFDIAGAPILQDALLAIDAGVRRVIRRRVILDLRAVTFVDSAGLLALLQASSTCREMAVVRGPRQVEKVFSLTGMEQHLSLIDHPAQIPAASAAAGVEPRVHPLARWSSFRSGAEAAERSGAETTESSGVVSPARPPAPASRGSLPGTA